MQPHGLTGNDHLVPGGLRRGLVSLVVRAPRQQGGPRRCVNRAEMTTLVKVSDRPQRRNHAGSPGRSDVAQSLESPWQLPPRPTAALNAQRIRAGQSTYPNNHHRGHVDGHDFEVYFDI